MAKEHGQVSPDESLPRTILAAVAGGSPAIITETLWKLAAEQGEQIDEIRVITTAKGKSAIWNRLLVSGKFAECCRESGLNPAQVKFDDETIFVLKDQMDATLADIRNPSVKSLDDIRDSRENGFAADQICLLIREWTNEPNSRVYASAAGGRKTMSIYLTAAMMLYGRADDRLMHVLIRPEEFEFCKEFFHPYREPRQLPLNDRDGKFQKHLNTADVMIDLAYVPFVSLRNQLPPKAYSKIVEDTQRRLRLYGREARLRVQKAFGKHSQVLIEINGEEFCLPPAAGLIYTLLAEKRMVADRSDESVAEGDGLKVEEIRHEDLNRVYHLLTGRRYSSTLEGTNFDFLVEWMNQIQSGLPKYLKAFKKSVEVAIARGVNKEFRRQGIPEKFHIANISRNAIDEQTGKRKPACYVLALPSNAIYLPDQKK